ncbi:10965_t:CDS:2 [Cetraspora pellucida]|uniref:10965_t:CDS:1 n=1 Tax=Cetraspora pellucida TaxID=1433469 RepID=A0A9N9G1E3_9GLOM|nr:10965_t:CDS:2 [Cetraspora pellucida]
MPSRAAKKYNGDTVFLTSISGTFVSHAHTVLGYCKFTFHNYHELLGIIVNYHEEWFPSVSATTGDWYPERAVFQIFIALNSAVGIIRTVSCGGWVYITSSDDHDIHDIAMIIYLVCTLPWMLGVLSTTPRTSHITSLKYRPFVFWSMLTALALLIWYFPLWHMGISGFEVFLLVTITPVFLAYDFMRKIVFKYRGFFHLLSLMGIASYTFKDPVYRLVLSSFGIGISLLTWFATWFGNRSKNSQLEYDISVWSLGLLLHNVIKMAWYSNNPIWPIMHEFNGGKNFIGLLLGIFACIGLIIRDFIDGKNKSSDKLLNNFSKIKSSWVSASLSLGAVMFGLHSMFTDSSTIMRWVVDGYPNYGPDPISWGFITILAMGMGLLISTNAKLSTSFLMYLVGCFSCIIVYFIPSWIGYYAGLVLGAYFMAITPYLIRSAMLHNPGRTLFTTMMVYNIFCLAHVWVVAYEFVPGGPLARERTNWILIFMMTFIGLGVLNTTSIINNYQLKKIRSIRNFIRIAIFGIIFLSIIVSFVRFKSAKTPVPYRPEHKMFTAGIWTIHFTLDNDMWSSEVRIKDAIRDLEFDVIGLLESDTQRIIMGNRDLWQYISEDLGYYVDYGPGPAKHTWGCAILSKFPIINSTHHLLPSPVGELACAIHATLNIYGQNVDFIVSHNGQEENLLDRELQTTELARIMRESSNPFVFLGYVVTEPFQHIYNILFDDGHINDIDPSEMSRWCEYIGFRGLKRISFARISHGHITDTEIQAGKFLVVNDSNDNNSNDNSNVDLNKQVQKDYYPASMRFPEMFYNEGIRGHRYDDTYPRYFA